MPLPTSCIVVITWADGTVSEFLVNGVPVTEVVGNVVLLRFTDTAGDEHTYLVHPTVMRGWKKKSIQ